MVHSFILEVSPGADQRLPKNPWLGVQQHIKQKGVHDANGFRPNAQPRGDEQLQNNNFR